MSQTEPSSSIAKIRIVQPARSEAEVVHHALPEATPNEVRASTCSCVVHLCGCSPG